MPRVMAFFRNLLRRDRVERDLDNELRATWDLLVDEKIRAGLQPDEARRAAMFELGGIEPVKEKVRDVRAGAAADTLLQDVRYAARLVRRAPGFSSVVIATLALGIGLTTAAFSVVNGLLLRPLPFDRPDELVALHTTRERGDTFDNALSAPNFMSLKEEESRTFANLAGALDTTRTLTGGGEALRLDGAQVSAGFFDVLGVRPIMGRTFHPQENEPGHGRVVVLSHALWQQQFGAEPDVIGRIIHLDAITHTVIGVMPPGFSFPRGDAFWLPQPYGSNFFSATSTAGRRGTAVVRVVGRLNRGVSLESAQAELDARSRQLEARFSDTNVGVSFSAVRLRDDLVRDVRTPLFLLFGAVGFVFLIAVANVAGLLLARGASRREEIALRGALGASRARIVRQLVTESLFLSLGGCALGLVLAFWATSEFVAARLDDLQRVGLAESVRVDSSVLGFAVVVSLLAGTLAGVVPALRLADGFAGDLQSAGRGGLPLQRGRRLRAALVVGQVALAVMLLHGAGLLLHSLIRLTSVDPGFRTEQVLSFRVGLPVTAYSSSEQVRTFFAALLDRITRHPGVVGVGAIHHLPIGSSGSFRSRFQIAGRTFQEEEPAIGVRIVTPEYFGAMGIPILRGRGISDQDRAGGLPVAVINERAAAQFFAGEDPIGQRLAGFGYDALENAADAFVVVGVVRDVRSLGLAEAPLAEAYFAHAQVPHRQMFVVVRTEGNPVPHVNSIRAEMRSIDVDLPTPLFQTLDQVIVNSISRPRVLTTLVGIFAGVALTLAAVGIFGLLSFVVAQRTREMAVRIALGALPSTLVTTIVRDALGFIVVGLSLGFGGALALTRMLRSELFNVTATDPATLGSVAFVLGITALLASLLPAWRAAAVDPMVALRTD